jgi:hypothetical protein
MLNKLLYKIRKLLGWTLVEDIVKDIDKNKPTNIKLQTEYSDNDWVTPSISVVI